MSIKNLVYIGIGIRGGFNYSSKLKILNYKEVIKSKNEVVQGKKINKEYDRIIKYNIQKPISIKYVPKDAE